MGSNETATATTGGPRVIDVFDGNGAPSGPNYLLFVDADRLAAALRDRVGVGWSPMPHAPVLGALQRALDRNLWQIMVQSNRAQRTLLICMHRWERPRMRGRRLPMSSSDPRRPPEGFWAMVIWRFRELWGLPRRLRVQVRRRARLQRRARPPGDARPEPHHDGDESPALEGVAREDARVPADPAALRGAPM